MIPRLLVPILALAILTIATIASASQAIRAADAQELLSLDGYSFQVRYSPGHEDRSRMTADRVASVLDHFGTRFDFTPDVELFVLAEAHWADHAGFPLYGMPHILDGRRLIVAAEDNPFWQRQLPDPAALPEATARVFRDVYGDGRGGLTGAPFFDLLAIHELGHAYHLQASVHVQRSWMGEFFPNLLLHSWVEEVAPELLPALTLLPELIVAGGSDAFEFTALADVETRIAEIVSRNPDNYGWYQARWQQGAWRVYEAGGSQVVDRLWAALRDTPERLDDDAFLALLDNRVHPAVGDIVRSWDAETLAPPPPRIVSPRHTEARLPVIDMHLHALMASSQGPPPVAMCTPFLYTVPWDPAEGPMTDRFMAAVKDPPCEDPVWSPETDEELMRETLDVLERLNVYGVTSGPASFVRRWRNEAPDRIIPALMLQLGPGQVPLDTLRAMHERGDLDVLGEVTTQYQGIHPADDALAPYWALAEELDIPVGIHVGTGPPGTPYLGLDGYRGSLHSALTMEEVLIRHPRLRVYLMHAGYPMIDDLLTLMYAHPQVYVDVGVIIFTRPRASFYRFLEAIVEAGYGNRVLFGSDQMVWPGVIERSIAIIEDAPFLSEARKRGILYDNAARFLRLSDEEIARHHAGVVGG